MKREAQPLLSENGQHALAQYAQVLQHLEDLSVVTVRNYLSDLRQFIAWCECSWCEAQEDRFFTPQAVLRHCSSAIGTISKPRSV